MSPRPARRRVLAIVGLGVLVVAAALMLLSPRHREFYFGTARRASTPVKQVATDVASGVASGVRIAMTGPPAEIKPVAVSTRGRTLAMDPDGRLRVPITTETPLPRLPADGVPKGWELREFTGRADVQMIRAPQGLAVLLKADRTSFALYRDVIVDLDVLPRLSWTWRVTKLPLRGDVRQKASDDQAAQVYVIFPRWPSPRATSDVIGYDRQPARLERSGRRGGVRARPAQFLAAPGARRRRGLRRPVRPAAVPGWRRGRHDRCQRYRQHGGGGDRPPDVLPAPVVNGSGAGVNPPAPVVNPSRKRRKWQPLC
jgi:hypothetical protein